MSVNTPGAFRLMGQIADRIAAEHEPSIEELRAAADASYRRYRRKQVVFKVIRWSSLIIIFCGSGLALVYALGL